jgi:DsbC/DsbD-like thiol-disulfide interchange protein
VAPVWPRRDRRVGHAWIRLAGLAMGSVLSACEPAAQRASARELDGAVTVRASAEQSEVRPGERLRIAVVLQYGRGYHSWPNEPMVPMEFEGVRPIPTAIEVVEVPEGTVVGSVLWPEPSPVVVYYTEAPVELLSYAGTTVAYVPLTLPPDVPAGRAEVMLQVRYQTCDERYCYFPKTVTLRVPIAVLPVTAGAPPGN